MLRLILPRPASRKGLAPISYLTVWLNDWHRIGARSHLKRALVTGGSGGLGRAMARKLAARGYGLVLVARDDAGVARVADELRAEYPNAEIETCVQDLAAPAAAERLAARFPAVDLVVNNAGFGATGAFLATDWAAYERMIELQVKALGHITYVYAAAMKARGSGTIMNIGALAGFGPTPNFAVFGATKAFVLNLSEALDFELRPFGVRVLAFCPGGVDTPFNAIARMSEKTRSLRMQPDAVAEKIVRAIEAGRERGVPGPIYRFIAFCYTHFPLLNRRIVAPLFARPQ
jgi:short-subunit dehydrogenase